MIVHPQVNGAGPSQAQMTRSQMLANLNEAVWIQIGKSPWLTTPAALVTDTGSRFVDGVVGRRRWRYRCLSTGLKAQPVVCRGDERHFPYFASTREVSRGHGVLAKHSQT